MQKTLHILLVLIGTLISIQSYAQCPTGSIMLSSQAQVDAFVAAYPSCQNPTGDVVIGSTSSSTISDITDISGLAFTSIGGSLSIRNNGALTNLTGLDNLTSVGASVSIFNNDALTSVGGLSSLTSIGLALSIQDNQLLTNLIGLDMVSSLGTNLTITNNPNLTSLMGLTGIIEVPRVLTIENNTLLASLSGLDNLVVVGGDLDIRSNLGLLTLDGLGSLQAIGGSFYIFANFQLNDISALMNLRDICGQFQIFKNVDLQMCAIPVACKFLLDENWGQFVFANGTGCATRDEIAASVAASTIDCDAALAAANYCTALSTELTELDAQLNGKQIEVTWATATETNNEGFEIQRSRDGITWKTIDWVAGNGTTASPKSYRFTDFNAYKGINYYRLKQIDFDGTATLSIVVDETIDGTTIDIYPNPAAEFLVVSGLDGSTIDEITIHDLMGKQALRLNDARNIIDISGLASGIYVVAILQGNQEQFLKLIVQ